MRHHWVVGILVGVTGACTGASDAMQDDGAVVAAPAPNGGDGRPNPGPAPDPGSTIDPEALCAISQETDEIIDGNFGVGWDSAIVLRASEGDFTLVSADRLADGGVGGGAYYHVIVRLEPTDEEAASIAVAHFSRNLGHDPQEDGPLCGLSGSLSRQPFDEDANPQGWRPDGTLLIEQGGVLYASGSALGEASDFTRLVGEGPEHPDFLRGERLRFGFLTEAQAEAGEGDRVRVVEGYDDFTLFLDLP